MATEEEINKLAKKLWCVWSERTKNAGLHYGQMSEEDRSLWREVAKSTYDYLEVSEA